jgi:hypothetical protein
VELKDQMVQCRAQVKEAVPDYQGPRGVDWLDLTNAEAVFATFVVSLTLNGAEMEVLAPAEFEFESAVMVCCPGDLRGGFFHTSGHEWKTYAASAEGAS